MAILLIYFFLMVFFLENMLKFSLTQIPGISLLNISIFLLLLGWIIKINARKKIIQPSGIDLSIILLVIYGFISILYQILVGPEKKLVLIQEIIALKVWVNPFIIFFCVYNILDTQNECKKTIYGLIFILFLSGLITPLNSIGVLDTAKRLDFYEGRSAGFSEPNQFAGFLVLFIPLVLTHTIFNEKKKYMAINAIVLITSLIALITTGSRGGLISLVACMCYYSYLLHRHNALLMKKIVILLVSLFIFLPVAYLLAPSQAKSTFIERLDPDSAEDMNRYTSGRLKHLQIGTKLFLDRPFFGHGLQGYNKFWIEKFSRPSATHNHYLDYLVSFGIFGLFLFFLIFYKIYRKINKYLMGESNLSEKLPSISYLAGYLGFACAMLAVNMGSNPRYMFWIYTAAILKSLQLKGKT